MLYTEPLYRLGDPERCFGYADDLALVRIGKSLEETSRQLATDLGEVLQWGKDNAIAFDPGKSELQHFSRKQGPDSPNVSAGSYSVEPSIGAIRWLGI